MELKQQNESALDISGGGTALTYAYGGSTPVEVAVRVDLGTTGGPIAGGGAYTLAFYINDTLVSPTNQLTIPSGQTAAILVSRPLPLAPADTLTLTVTGRPADTAVSTRVSVRDMTAVKQSDVAGVGAVAVDHNYGGADTLAFKTAAGVGIDGATVAAYLKADYQASRTGPLYVKGRAVTDVNGRWTAPMLLDPATYTLVFYKQGAYGTTAADVVVT